MNEKLSEDYEGTRAYDLLKNYGFTDEDIEERIINHAKEKLREKEFVEHKNPVTGETEKFPQGEFVTIRQFDCPYKLVVLKEICLPQKEEPEVKIGYYTLKFTALKEEGKLHLSWGERGASVPKDDFLKLIEKARKKGILTS